MPVRTVEDVKARFKLISGAGDGETSACAMTALSWIAGEAWTDTPDCAHPLLSYLIVGANDAPETTPAQRVAIVEAGVDGVIDTWWVPDSVIVWAISRATGKRPATRARNVALLIAAWKQDKQRANLRYADLPNANLRYTDLRHAHLYNADLSNADLSNANLSNANLSNADLRYAHLYNADLSDADLSNANLSSADLSNADLSNANLRYAHLYNADLSDADLSNADLYNADLSDADLYNADLSNAVGLILPTGWKINAQGQAERA